MLHPAIMYPTQIGELGRILQDYDSDDRPAILEAALKELPYPSNHDIHTALEGVMLPDRCMLLTELFVRCQEHVPRCRYGTRSKVEYLQLLAEHPQGLRTRDIAFQLQVSSSAVSAWAKLACQRGDIERLARGMYRVRVEPLV